LSEILFLADAATQAAQSGPEALTTLWSTQALVALLTLTLLEVVLGIDNVIFISILSKKLGPGASDRARLIGLALAMILRIVLLLSISWIMGLTGAVPLIGDRLGFLLGDDRPFNWRDLILLTGGLFLIYKSVSEIHEKLEGDDHAVGGGTRSVTFAGVLTQILIMDLIFSLDSVITAVGMIQTTPENRSVGITLMVISIMIAIGVMLLASRSIAEFVDRHPTVKMLALSFLVLIGTVLIVDSTHRHIPKGYIYFSMAFAIGVEMLNLRLRGKAQPVHLRQNYVGQKLAEHVPGA
jgi:predicted tellurium resistance membrane protein TerC